MKKVTKIDFEKLRQLIMYFKAPNDTRFGEPNVIGNSLKRFYDETYPTMTYLVNYYYEKIDEPGAEVITEGTPPGMTQKQRVLYALSMGHRNIEAVLEKYSEGFEPAMQHHEEASAKKLQEALDENLSSMTGEQFILLLQEYDKRKASL